MRFTVHSTSGRRFFCQRSQSLSIQRKWVHRDRILRHNLFQAIRYTLPNILYCFQFVFPVLSEPERLAGSGLLISLLPIDSIVHALARLRRSLMFVEKHNGIEHPTP